MGYKQLNPLTLLKKIVHSSIKNSEGPKFDETQAPCAITKITPPLDHTCCDQK
jgi:hypothetical protein